MDGAALLLLVSGVGVAFGWQPMPDGTPRYEYVVQIEPELAATLADGKSIPIVSEIPPDVQPVGRIRVVVGREAPPRQRLVTLLKPATTASEADSSKIQLAQYDNPYAGQRYAAAPAQEAPPQTSWNNQQPEAPITPTGEAPPSTQQLFGQSNGTAWNSGAAADSVASAATDALSRVGSEIQQSVDPIVRNGVERVDAEVRAAADSLGDRTRNLVDGIRQPLRMQQPGAGQPAPAASAATSQAERSWNDPPAGDPLRENADAGATWNGPAAVTQGSSGQPGAAPAPASPMSATPGLTAPPFAAGQTGAAQQQPGAYDWNATPAANSPGATTPGTTGQPKLDDPWANAPDPRGYPAVADSQSGARPDAAAGTRPLPFGGLGTDASTMGPRFPGMGVPITGQQPSVGAPTATAQPGVGATVGQPPAAVGRRLLNQPADRPLDEVAGPAPMTPAPGTTTASTPTTPPWSAATQRPGATAATTPTTPVLNTPLPAAIQPAAQATASNAAAVLVAWVLLSGSIAGNFYLFWSYLDVRHKYRAVVRKTARAVGTRFSAA